MEKQKDFSSMSLDALSSIVSMRPGKEYTKEELRAARSAFMAALYGVPEACSPPSSPVLEEDPVPDEAESCEAESPVFEEDNPACIDAAVESSDAAEEAFILKAESRLARFLYVFYAYFCVPLLAIESLVFLAGSVATAVLVPDIPFLWIPITAALFYTMFVSFSWHQFLYRTRLGLFLNRSLILTCFFRGIRMISKPHSLLSGVVFVAISILFLVFFFGYDHTFIIGSPKRRREQ